MNNQKNDNYMNDSWQPLIMCVSGLAALGIYQNPETVKWMLIKASDKIFLIICALLYFVIYKYLSKKIKEGKDEINQASLAVELKSSESINEISVGRSLRTNKMVTLSDALRCGHVQVIGATGRGKTESVILPWMYQDVKSGKSVLLIDGKGDAELAARIKEFLPSTKIFDPNSAKGATLNPLEFGSPQQITDRIMSAFDFGEQYYKSVQGAEVLLIVKVLKESKHVVTFKNIHRALTSKEFFLDIAMKSQNQELLERTRNSLHNADKRAELMSGITSKLAPFAVGDLSEIVNGRVAGRGSISITELISATTLIPAVILLPTLMYPEMGKALGRMLLQEVAFGVGKRSAYMGQEKSMVSVFLDEFSSFTYHGFEQILNKARSAKVAMHISHQSMGDLEDVGPAFAKIINTNTNVKCLFGLNDPDTANFFAAHIGTVTSEKLTERAQDQDTLWGKTEKRTGEKSLREVEKFRFHPNQLKSLSSGQGVLCVPTAGGIFADLVQFERLKEVA